MIAQTAANRGMTDDAIQDLMNYDTRPDPVPCPHCGKLMEWMPVEADGTFFAWRPFPGPCENPACVEKEKQIKQQREQRERLQELETKLQAAGVPALYRRCTLNGFNAGGNASLESAKQKALIFVRQMTDYRQLKGRGLWLCGPTGTGKSHIAAAAARGALLQGLFAVYTTAAQMMEKIKNAFGSDEADAVLARYVNTTLLVIDDFGKEHGSEWSVEKLLEIIDARYSAQRPTVYTSNMRPDDLSKRLADAGGRDTADALMSRMRGTSDVLIMAAADYRMREETA